MGNYAALTTARERARNTTSKDKGGTLMTNRFCTVSAAVFALLFVTVPARAATIEVVNLLLTAATS
jgi:hypothetical protein